jgi:DnaJ-class molecular chaperone
MAIKRDFYDILNVKRDASEKDIRQAYRRLARKLHPDVNPNDKVAEERFKEVSEAYEVLSDKEKRAKYDRYGHDWQFGEQAEAARAQANGARRGRVRTEADLSDFEDLFGGRGGGSGMFGDLFGRRGGGRGSSGAGIESLPGQDYEQPVSITLEEAFNGTTRLIGVPAADGSTRRLEVRIPAGVREGSRVRMASEGAPGPFGGPKGDLYLVVSIEPNRAFEREGDDLIVKVPVPLHIAMLGGEVEVPTLKGTKLALRIQPETQNGRRIRLKGQGMPHLGSSERGDLYAETSVILPTRLNDEERKLFERLAELRSADGSRG